MAAPADYSRPHLAPGCRWGKQGEDPVVLYPEGMIRLQGTGRNILELCDGQRTFQEIVTVLAEQYQRGDPERIRSDVAAFLEALSQKRVVDY